MKVKSWRADETGQPSFPKDYKVTRRWEGNCAEIAKNSNKFYHAEIQVASNGQARIFTIYGRVGQKALAMEYRYYSSESSCLSDYEGLIEKKRDRKKDPYREVDLAITSVGSEGAKNIKKSMTGITISKVMNTSSLHSEVQRLVAGWFGSTGHFVEMNLKCPLGQLTKEQIDKGRQVLDECKNRINTNKKTSPDVYDNLTSQFYSLIPHILPHRIDPTSLRLDQIDRIMAKHDTLDTFLDAKNVSSVIGKGVAVDEQYKKLNAELDWLEPASPIYKWISSLVMETRAKNHSFLGSIKIYNIFKLSRVNESDNFLNTAEHISEEIKSSKLEKPRFTRLDRPDLTKEENNLFTRVNVWPLWHGTRPQNMVGIITRGLLIRPSGAVYTGSMFGSGIYFAESFTKSANYCGCRGAYWSGTQKNDKAYIFLSNVVVGHPHLIYRSQYFTTPPRGTHSIYALPGQGLFNSENIVYSQTGPKQQHKLQYIVEFQTKV